jgi:pimeloyl-ACP methyl ester carboxylesterase
VTAPTSAAGSSAAGTTASTPAPRAVAVAHGAGLAHGVAWQWPDSDLAVLMLHDLGGDLDDLRWVAEPLAAAGTDVLSLDLPGHGLSDGEGDSAKRDTAAAIGAAWELLAADPGRAACVLAEGRTAEIVLGLDLPEPPVAAVLLAPRRGRATAEGTGVTAVTAVTDGPWTCVPKLIIAPTDAGYADDIVGATRAWCLRADLDPADRDAFAVQVTSLTLKFLLEQAVFELASRNAGRPDGSA